MQGLVASNRPVSKAGKDVGGDTDPKTLVRTGRVKVVTDICKGTR